MIKSTMNQFDGSRFIGHLKRDTMYIHYYTDITVQIVRVT